MTLTLMKLTEHLIKYRPKHSQLSTSKSPTFKLKEWLKKANTTKSILKKIFTQSNHKLSTFQHTVYIFRHCCAINTRTKVRIIYS